MRFHPAIASLAVICSLATGASAQQFPSKPIRWIVPSSPGGSADAVTRVVADGVAKVLGQRIIVENRAGAGGNIGAAAAAKSPPDGYTWIMINNAQAANVSLYANLPYDLVRDFAPVTQIDSSPHVIVVHPSLPVNSVDDLVKLAKAKPGQLDYSSAGLGTVSFLAAELFNSAAGVKLRHVPYRGGGESMISIVAGETMVSFTPLAGSLPYMRNGRLRALAVTSMKRISFVPEIPTVAESGYPNYEFNLWNGLMVPAGTPKETVTTIRSAVITALNAPELKSRLVGTGLNVIGSEPDEFGAFVKSEIDRIAKVVTELGLTAESLK